MTPEQAQQLIENTRNGSTVLGAETSIMGEEDLVTVSDDNRLLHTAVLGPTGQGKTNLLQSIALQDSHKAGFAFLNPKGGVIDDILAKLPENRLDDVIYINPNESRCPGINLLKPDTTEEMTRGERVNQQKIVVSSMMAMFRRLTEEWGERWPRHLRSLLNTHISLNIHQGENYTLMDVYEAVTDNERLGKLIDRTADTVSQRQLKDLKSLSQREREPLLRRLSDIVENPTVRRIVSQPRNQVSFREALQNQEIILVDAQGGHVGDWAAGLIGSVVLTRLWTATASRSTEPRANHPIYHVYIDEVQEFVSEADHLRRMLAQCRSFQVSLTAATQYLDDLDSTMADALMNNTLTKIVFHPSASKDLHRINTIMNGLSKDELSQLGKYRPAIQLPAEQTVPQAEVVDTLPPWKHQPETLERRKEKILNQYRELEDPAQDVHQDLGSGGSAGGEKHEEMLREAKQFLEFEEDVQVKLLEQDGGDKPDGHVVDGEEILHLEAEHTTLTRPERVHKNLERATDQGRDCIFIVQADRVQRLQEILEDQDSSQYQVLVSTDLGVTWP